MGEFRIGALAVASLALCCMAPEAEARITRIEIKSVTPAFGGRSFRAVGSYERVVGVAHGEVDPKHRLNTGIQDIGLAPVNQRGRVEYSMTFVILRPTDLSKANGMLIYDVVNRGNMTAAAFDLGASRTHPASDGLLERKGYIIAAAGWQGDVRPGESRLSLQVPVASDRGRMITGTVRGEFDVDAPALTEGVGAGPFSPAETTDFYETVDLNDPNATLTERRRTSDAPAPVARARWAFAKCDADHPFPGVPDPSSICLKGGFQPDTIYDLVYTAKNPKVLGLGFASSRDFVEFLKRASEDDAHTKNPIAGATKSAIIWGLSQSGAYVRTFVDLGFNEGEDGRRVFDGAYVHIAAVRLPLNVRFGQPSRGPGGRYAEYLYPRAEMPLAWNGDRGGLLAVCKRSNTCPKIIQSVTGTEYWESTMSLDTTSVDGKRDLPLPDDVRLYYIASTEHVPGMPGQICKYPGNPNETWPTMRALMLALSDWVTTGVAPPSSRYPRIADGTLAPADQIGFPNVPGVEFTGLHREARMLDFGPAFNSARESGVITREAPGVGESYVVLEPRVDADGNDLAGVRTATLQAPLGTYTGWNIRKPGYIGGELCDLNGSYFPFAATRADRLAKGDARPSLEERYHTHDGYVAAVTAATRRLVSERLLLPEDAASIVEDAADSSVLR